MAKGEFYTHFAAEPIFNMAMDEWLARRAGERDDLVCLRLYTWRPGAITFGLNQRLETAVDHTRLGDTMLIRRATGGRALYHDPSELTYAIAYRDGSDLPSSLREGPRSAQEGVAAALVAFLDAVGVAGEFVRRSSSANARPDVFHKAPCFASHARYEVVSDRGKLIASAARRSGGVTLQHGSMKLRGLAPHPALAVESERTVPGGVAVSRSEFARFAEVFREVMSARLGCDFCAGETMRADPLSFRRVYDAVVEKRLQRREIFEQS